MCGYCEVCDSIFNSVEPVGLISFIFVPTCRKILEEDGSVADAAITALLCEGVTCPQSTGLGGGFVMTIFHKASNKVETLIARDVAPSAATWDMFNNTDKVSGGLAIAVPGELKGYGELHKKYGKLKWSRLFEPIIELCRKGHIVSPYLGGILESRKETVFNSPTLREIYVDPITNDTYKVGDRVKRLKLADTFEIIQREGADSIYNNGTIGRMMVKDIEDIGGIITTKDLMDYNVLWREPITVKLENNKQLYTVPLPGSGPIVAFIMNVLKGFLPKEMSTLAMQRIAETFKYAYAKRSDLGDDRFEESVREVIHNLTDENFAREIREKITDTETFNDHKHYGANFSLQEDHGTAHVNILAPNGDAISVTGTINTL